VIDFSTGTYSTRPFPIPHHLRAGLALRVPCSPRAPGTITEPPRTSNAAQNSTTTTRSAGARRGGRGHRERDHGRALVENQPGFAGVFAVHTGAQPPPRSSARPAPSTCCAPSQEVALTRARSGRHQRGRTRSRDALGLAWVPPIHGASRPASKLDSLAADARAVCKPVENIDARPDVARRAHACPSPSVASEPWTGNTGRLSISSNLDWLSNERTSPNGRTSPGRSVGS
jgi:hypothetical protein